MARDILKKLVSQEALERPPFMPLFHSYAARLVQVPVRRMLTSPALLAKGILTAYELIHSDLLVFPFDPALEAEALGTALTFRPEAAPVIEQPCFSTLAPPDEPLDTLIHKGRLPIITETLDRLRGQAGREVDIVAGVTGPLTMAFQLRGHAFREDFLTDRQEALRFLEFAGQVVTRIIRNYGETGVNGILLIESSFSLAGQDMISSLKPLCTPVLNTCNYYELPVIFCPDAIGEAGGEVLLDLPWSGFIIRNPVQHEQLIKELSAKGRCIGMPVALENIMDQRGKAIQDQINECIKIGGNNGIFFTTEGDPPHQTPVEHFHEIMKCLAGN